MTTKLLVALLSASLLAQAIELHVVVGILGMVLCGIILPLWIFSTKSKDRELEKKELLVQDLKKEIEQLKKQILDNQLASIVNQFERKIASLMEIVEARVRHSTHAVTDEAHALVTTMAEKKGRIEGSMEQEK